MDGKFYASDILISVKEPTVSVWQAGYTPHLVWTRWRQKTSCRYRESKPLQKSHVVTLQTQPPRLSYPCSLSAVKICAQIANTEKRRHVCCAYEKQSVANNCQSDDAEHLAQGYRPLVDCTLHRLQDPHTLTSEPERQTMLFRTLFFFFFAAEGRKKNPN